MTAIREAEPGEALQAHTIHMTQRIGALHLGRNLIFLSDRLSPHEAAFGEAHLRFHALMRTAHDCDEANQVAAISLIPSVKLLEVALRDAHTAVEAADELGVAVHVLVHRLEGLVELDSERVAALWCEVEWPAEGELQGFECLVADITAERAVRIELAGKAA
ncbi:hypothetical protein RCF19_30160 [Rhodococcus qingshengii]